MFEDENEGWLLQSILEGLSRGFIVSLVVMVAVDAIAFLDAFHLLSIRIQHPSIVTCLIMTLLPLAAWLEVEHEQYRRQVTMRTTA
jgi:hypothetical protein